MADGARDFDLRITEIWPGNDPGDNLTEDWFEVSNVGTEAWIAAQDGALFFDDESREATDADLLSGVDGVAPGESVVFVNGDRDGYLSVWGERIAASGFQIGEYDGAGLGQGGDGVALFLDAGFDGVDARDLIDFQSFPSARLFGGRSWDALAAAFSIAGVDGATATSVANDAGQPAVGSPGFAMSAVFTLELLHLSDQEASTGAIQDAPNLSAVMNALRAQDLGGDGLADNTLTLSSGDALIPSVFFGASAAAFGSGGIADILINSELGIEAIAFGNHEFDFNTAVLAGLISGSAAGVDQNGDDFAGTLFPYLSANLDFSTDPNMAPLETAGGQRVDGANTLAGKVTSSIVKEVGGELIGVVGATTPTLGRISSPGSVGISPDWAGTAPTDAELDALAAEIQAEVDALLAANPAMNKVILLAHMQQLSIELALAERLENVDVIVAGGSHLRLFDDDDRIRAGDSDQGQYPQFVTNAGGGTTAVVNTDGSYKYVGRLVIDFDADGNVIAESYDETVSGAYATDAQGVSDLGAEALIDPEIQQIVDAIEARIIATESNVFGVSEVYLNGARNGTADAASLDGVRSQQTNLGDLTADANLAVARDVDETVVVSIKNGGGIRASIGQTIVQAGAFEPSRLPNDAILDGDGNVIKPQGGISENDIKTALAFNNGLSLLTLTREELVAVLEHGLANVGAGQFMQVSGVKLSFDPDRPAGDRIETAAIVNEAGETIALLKQDGDLVGDPDQSFRIVTLNFMADGGDGYPFPDSDAAERLNLYDLDADGANDGATGAALFADDGTEQDALAEYLRANFFDTPFADADDARTDDARIQNLNFREEDIAPPAEPAGSVLITEIVEGSSNSKAVEIYNGTGEAIDLAAEGYALKFYFNGAATAGLTIALSGTVEAGRTWVVAQSAAAADILAAADQTSGAGWFNGDDAIALFRGDSVVDSFGQVGVDPGSEWQGGGQDDTLRRKDGVVSGDANPDDAFATADEWDVFPRDDFSDLGRYGEDDGSGGGGDPEPLSAKIHEIQGETDFTGLLAMVGVDDLSPLLGQFVAIEAVVTADFQTSAFLSGFFVQEEDADADANAFTSEGLFVFDGGAPAIDVAAGDLVRVTGTVGEFFGSTQLAATSVEVLSSGNALPSYTQIGFPDAGVMLDGNGGYVADLEATEGMLVEIAQAMTVNELFNLDRFGEARVSDGRLEQFTQNNAPDVAGYDQHLRDVAAASLVLDDGRGSQNPDPIFVNDGDDGALAASDSYGIGDTLTNIRGALTYGFDEFRIHRAEADYADATPRPAAPTVEGSFRVASLNVLNYFTTLDQGGAAIDNGLEPRGANSVEEFERQAAKLVQAIVAMDADVLGLNEIENDFAGETFAIKDLVARVNAALGAEAYGWVDPGAEFVGTDAISTAFIYKTATTNLVGEAVVLDDPAFTDPNGTGQQRSRPAVIQTFEEVASGERLTVAVNHLKSKGAGDAAGLDADQGDGAGAWNDTRAKAAAFLADFLATDPTGSGDHDFLIVGDLNSYASEAPIAALEAAGYTNLARALEGEDVHSYVFDGQVGTLDYALANRALLGQVADVETWNINSDEADAFDYNLDFGRNPALFDGSTAARSSDHDPVIVGLNLRTEPEYNVIAGDDGADVLRGTDGADLIIGGGGANLMTGNGGADVFLFGSELENGRREVSQIRDYAADEDAIDLGGYAVESFRETAAGVRITMEGDGDTIFVRGVTDFDRIVFVEDVLVA